MLGGYSTRAFREHLNAVYFTVAWAQRACENNLGAPVVNLLSPPTKYLQSQILRKCYITGNTKYGADTLSAPFRVLTEISLIDRVRWSAFVVIAA